jgi:hypothetical protein
MIALRSIAAFRLMSRFAQEQGSFRSTTHLLIKFPNGHLNIMPFNTFTEDASVPRSGAGREFLKVALMALEASEPLWGKRAEADAFFGRRNFFSTRVYMGY